MNNYSSDWYDIFKSLPEQVQHSLLRWSISVTDNDKRDTRIIITDPHGIRPSKAEISRAVGSLRRSVTTATATVPFIRFVPKTAKHARAWAKFSRLSSKRAKKRAENLLVRIESCVPRKHRQFLLGDLWEDIKEFREAGFSEKELVRMVKRQLAFILLERLYFVVRPDRWAWAALAHWAFGKWTRK